MMKPNQDQRDRGLGFDGLDNRDSAPRNTRSARVQVNQHSGHANDGRLQQMAQAPNRRGNRDVGSTKKGAPSSVPDTHPASSPGMPQYRGVGGTPMGGPGFPNPDRIRMP